MLLHLLLTADMTVWCLNWFLPWISKALLEPMWLTALGFLSDGLAFTGSDWCRTSIFYTGIFCLSLWMGLQLNYKQFKLMVWFTNGLCKTVLAFYCIDSFVGNPTWAVVLPIFCAVDLLDAISPSSCLTCLREEERCTCVRKLGFGDVPGLASSAAGVEEWLFA